MALEHSEAQKGEFKRVAARQQRRRIMATGALWAVLGLLLVGRGFDVAWQIGLGVLAVIVLLLSVGIVILSQQCPACGTFLQRMNPWQIPSQCSRCRVALRD